MSRRLFRFVVILPFLFLSGKTQAQRTPHPASIPLQINGQVRYAQVGRPAELVLVRLESFGGGIVGEFTTDRSGRFTFTGLQSDLYIVTVRVAGFQEAQQQVDLRTQLTDYIQMQLVPEKRTPNSPPATNHPGVVDATVPAAAVAEFEKGRDALLLANNSDEGIMHLESAVKIHPKYLAALLLLGAAYMDRREWDKAETTLRQVLSLEPKTTAAHLALGELYLQQKKYSESENELVAGIKLDADSVRGHLMLGRLYYQIGAITKAGQQVGTALQLNPKLAQGHLLAGNILLRARQADNALIEFEEYLRLEPNGEFAEETKQVAQKIRETLPRKKSNP